MDRQDSRQGRGAPRLTTGRVVAGAALMALAGFAAYSLWWEPAMRLRVVRWRLFPREWIGRDPVRIVVLSDLHAGAPHLGLGRVRRIVARANALDPDVAVVLGDISAAHPFTWGDTGHGPIAACLSALRAREGRFAAIGNRPGWRDDGAATQAALENVGIAVLDDKALRIGGAARGFWLAGLGLPAVDGDPDRDLAAPGDGLDRALRYVTDDAPVVLLAHDPAIFPRLDAALQAIPVQISGHAPLDQIGLSDGMATRMARTNTPYHWGRYDEDGRTLVVSGGLGCSVLPMRVGCIPEITVIDIAPPHLLRPIDGAAALANESDPV